MSASTRVAMRIVYAGDWTGSMQIFAANPSGRAPLGQVTFAHPAGSCYSPAACGFTKPRPSPDGRWLAYAQTIVSFAEAPMLWLARANGTQARRVGRANDYAWAPDSRRLAYSASDGIHVVTTSGRDRLVDPSTAGMLRWSPDGKTLAFVTGTEVVLLRRGHERVLVHASATSIAWSPDGRRIAYGTSNGIYLISSAGGRPRLAYQPTQTDLYGLYGLELAFSPNGRYLAFAYGSFIRLLEMPTLKVRLLTSAGGSDLDWAPDSHSLLYVQGGEDSEGDEISTGDVQTVTPAGRVRTVISGKRPYGGQLVAAAWAKVPLGVRYRAPQKVDGVFAGGPVQEIAADGDHVGFIACGGVSAWRPSSGAVATVQTLQAGCLAWFSRAHVYSVGVAGDRLAWIEKGYGLCFGWTAHEATLGAPPQELTSGNGCLGTAPPDGWGQTAGAGSLLVLSHWQAHYGNGAGLVVDRQAVVRVDPAGCPCPELSSSPGPYTLLDANDNRIVVSGKNETRILAADGSILLRLPVPTLAAQLDGTELVLATASQLRVYDASTGTLRATWPLPSPSDGHDCDLYGDPNCQKPADLTLGDVAHRLAAYAFDGHVHVLRLADGNDHIVGYGALPRFTAAGLIYADGARIRLVPLNKLPR